MAVYLRAYQTSIGITHTDVADVFKYPGGEVSLSHVMPETFAAIYVAEVKGADLDDLMTAALWADVAHDREMPFVLMLPYLPAARADRGEPCGKYVYAKFIETMGADELITIDAHSTTGEQWYRTLRNIEPLPLLDRTLASQGHWRYDAIIAPDKGAADRAGDVAKYYGLDLVVANKERDFDTGRITRYTLPKLAKGKYLVVDDICDGGGTFLMLANESGLSKENLDLWVTHGIFSGGAANLRNYYGQIMTTDSHPGSGRVGVATSLIPTSMYMHETMLKGFK